MIMKQAIANIVGSTLLAGCSVVGVRAGTEEPPYQVLSQISDGIELRQYGERLAAEVSMDSRSPRANENSAFSILAGYIFGDNRTQTKVSMTSPVATNLPSEKIAMTTPVETNTQDDGLYTMRFFLPEAYSLDTAPVPNNPQVNLVPVPRQIIAAIKFSGWRNQEAVSKHEDVLMRSLNESKWKPTSDPVAFFYDPPWTAPFLRRNEVAVTVALRDK